MAKVEIKQPIVDEIKGYAADAKAAVLVDYRGLTVEQDTKLRKALREAGVVYKVYKNDVTEEGLSFLHSWIRIWKDLLQLHFQQRMRPLQRVFSMTLQKKQRHFSSRAVL